MHASPVVSRRDILTGFLATSCIGAMPIRAYAIEPMTVLAAGAAIVSILSGVAGILSDDRKDAILKDINGKLGTVIRNQQIILAEIQSLRLYIDESLYRSFRENTVIRMNAHQDRYEVLVAERPNASNRAEYIDLETSVSQTTFELAQYDTPAYIAYGAGVAMTLAIHQALRLSTDRFSTFKQVFKRAYDRWLEPTNPKSIVAICTSTKSEIDQRTAALNARQRVYTSTATHGRCTYTTTVTVGGDLQSGFNSSGGTTKDCLPPESICDRRPRFCVTGIGKELGDTEADVGRRLFSMLAINTPAGVAEVTVPQFVPSGSDVVDGMNRERIAIFELMNLLARQQIIQQQIEQSRAALSS